jgi:hypothetical protein
MAAITVPEGTLPVTTVTAEDADDDVLTFEITGGEDAGQFGINPDTGELVFLTEPNYDLPRDEDGDNVYIVIVTVRDGTGGEDTQIIEVTVTDTFTDSDGDGFEDRFEIENGSDPFDADTDDDGIIDSEEPNPYEDSDGDGINNVNDPDSDNDGLSDGTEVGITTPNEDTDISAGFFIPDADPTTTTDPLNPDSDEGGVLDGDEDLNRDGKVDEGERDPLFAIDDIDQNGDGFRDDTTLSGSGCDQSSDRPETLPLWILLFSLLLVSRRWVRRGSAWLALLLAIAVHAPTAKAQEISEPSSFALNRYIPALTTLGVLNAQSPSLPESPWGISMNFSIF